MSAPDDADEARARYLRDIETRFVALRGRGFALSARDVGRVLEWSARGVPLRVVMGVLEEAMRRWRADGARRAPTLGGLERSIDAAMKRRAERVISKADDAGQDGTEWARLRRAVEVAGSAQSDEAARAILRRAWATLKREEEAKADAWAIAARLDVELAEAFEAIITDGDRPALAREVEDALALAGGHMSNAAATERRLFERARWTRRRYALPDLVGVLLG